MSQQLLLQLLNNPENFAREYIRHPPEFLYNDPQTCCLLRNDDKESQTCPGVNHGYLGRRGKVGVPYLVEVNDETLILKTSQPGQLSLIYREKPPSSIRSFEETIRQAPTRCGFPDISDLRYLGADEFTNEMLIGIILTSFIKNWNEQTRNNFYPLVEYIASSVCLDNNPGLPITSSRPIGIHLMEFANLGTLIDLSKSPETEQYRQVSKVYDPSSEYRENITIEVVKVEVIFQVIRQVIASLHLIQNEFDFNHGDLKIANIFVSSQPAEGEYEGLDISAPFTCKVADYGKSSLTIETEKGPCRIYNRSWLADRYLNLNPFTPLINIERVGFIGEPFFIIQGLLTVHLYTRTRHMGIPFYLAFDTYSFLISLLLIPGFYYSFFNTPQLVEKIWNPLWFGRDAALMQQAILDFLDDPKKAQSISTVLDLLKGVRLRCNATNILLNNLRQVEGI